MSGIYHPPPTHQISLAMQRRCSQRIVDGSDEDIFLYLADTVYQERKRIEDGNAEDAPEQYQSLLKSAARALQRNRTAMEAALMNLVDAYAKEIHTQFSPRTYAFASKMLPGALTRLLTAAQPSQIFGSDFDPASRIVIDGPIEKLQQLATNHTLVFTPTHLSNLDSPLIGYALSLANLPPVIYGAGLNLFSNPLMAFFMSRLGAYTVDRRKNNRLYKDVLKDYSVECLQRGCHSLFYPGGTRSRDGSIEKKLKRGLLGTVIQAWQENLSQQKKNPELLVVPCTLSSSLVLEAETLIEDALSEVGKSRYIITDDEFSETRILANFTRKVLNLESSLHVQFGDPLDCIGNVVDSAGISLDPKGNRVDRNEYITNKRGRIEVDEQRDQQYTNRLADSIIHSYRKNNIILSTHLVAFSAWSILCDRFPRLDDVQRALLTEEERTISQKMLLHRIDDIHATIQQLVDQKQVLANIPQNTKRILSNALQQFSLYHKQPVVKPQTGQNMIVNSKLALYYGNRLSSYNIDWSRL